jgi:hypothetical protein
MTGEGGGNLPARRFGDDEVAAILRRASVRDLATGLPSPHDPTLADLMAAAAEVGLDPGEVRRAAALVPAAGGGAATAVIGAPDRRACSAVLDGTTLPEARQNMVREAERHLGGNGQIMVSEPDRLVWQETHLGGRTTVEVRAVDGATEIDVRADRAGHYLGLWFLGLVGWATVSALSPLALPALPAALAFLAIPPLLVRPLWVRADRRLRARLEGAVMALARAVEEGAPAPPRDGSGEGGA